MPAIYQQFAGTTVKTVPDVPEYLTGRGRQSTMSSTYFTGSTGNGSACDLSVFNRQYRQG